MSDFGKKIAWQFTSTDGVPVPLDVKPWTCNRSLDMSMWVGGFTQRVVARWAPDGTLRVVATHRLPDMPIVDMGIVNDIETVKNVMHTWYLLTGQGHDNGTT